MSEHDEDAFWTDPQAYIRNAVDAGVRINNEREKTANAFKAKFPDVDLGQAGFIANRDAEAISGMSTDQAIQHVGNTCRKEMGAATSMAGSNSNPGSTGSIIKRRREARRSARLGLSTGNKR